MYKNFEGGSACRQTNSCACRNSSGNGNGINGCVPENSQKHSWGLENYPLASVYAPLQSFDELYDKETALQKGTVFAQLDLPFMGESVYKGGCCRG